MSNFISPADDIAYSLHTANLIAQRNYLVESAFDRKLSDNEQAILDSLDVTIAERLGLNV